jgi:hypothetical protein
MHVHFEWRLRISSIILAFFHPYYTIVVQGKWELFKK